jgi:membrane fusion protein, heavy metal efflux system
MKRSHLFRLLILGVFLVAGCARGHAEKETPSQKSGRDAMDVASATEAAADSDRSQDQSLDCSEHGVPEEACGICHPELADRLLPGQGLKIRFPSAVSAAKAGVEAWPVTETEAGGFVEAMGRLEMNRNRAAKIATPVEGLVTRVLVDLGQPVKKGQVLVEINSRQWGEARASFIEARAEEQAAEAALGREEELHKERVSSTRDLEEARARYEAARATRQAAEGTLGSLGFTSEAAIDAKDPWLPLRAPFAGTVVARTATVGETAAPGGVLFEIADLDPLWAILSLPQASAASLHHGDSVEILIGGSPAATASIDWIADAIDPSTRMVQIRAVVPNPNKTLRAGTFIEARVHTGGNNHAVLVSPDAVYRFGGKPFVFLELAPDLYEVRRVDLAGEASGAVAVVAGLRPGDRVVSRQSYLVKSEFQKSRLGAGCVD